MVKDEASKIGRTQNANVLKVFYRIRICLSSDRKPLEFGFWFAVVVVIAYLFAFNQGG